MAFPAGLAMPALDHLASINTLNLILDRMLVGLPAKLQRSVEVTNLFVNFCRLTDKALRDYEAARADLLNYASRRGTLVDYLRAIDHLENCVDAAHRAVLNADALRANRVGTGPGRITDTQKDRVRAVRHAVEHSDERILRRSQSPHRPPFQPGQPFSLFPENTRVTIGQHVLTYRQLTAVITKCHNMIESIRGVPTGMPSTPAPGASGSVYVSDYFRQLMRLSITHP
jgi:hypothetical protein